MKSFWKSKTLAGFALVLMASAPGLSDQIWDVMTAAGVSDHWVARVQLAAYAAGAVGVVYGRMVASGPLTRRKI